jgi:hypothetical protein
MNRLIRIMAIVLALLTVSDLAFAQRRGGGGFRGGGGMRGGGFRGGGFSGRASARPTINRPAQRPAVSRPAARPSTPINRPSQLPAAGRGNRTNISRDRINTGDRVNRIGDNYINRDVNIDRDFDGDWDWDDDGCCWGVGAGIVAGAATAAALSYGTVVYALPTGCSTVIVNGISYYDCSGTWYEPQFVGQTVEYTVVAPPQ